MRIMNRSIEMEEPVVYAAMNYRVSGKYRFIEIHDIMLAPGSLF